MESVYKFANHIVVYTSVTYSLKIIILTSINVPRSKKALKIKLTFTSCFKNALPWVYNKHNDSKFNQNTFVLVVFVHVNINAAPLKPNRFGKCS